MLSAEAKRQSAVVAGLVAEVGFVLEELNAVMQEVALASSRDCDAEDSSDAARVLLEAAVVALESITRMAAARLEACEAGLAAADVRRTEAQRARARAESEVAALRRQLSREHALARDMAIATSETVPRAAYDQAHADMRRLQCELGRLIRASEEAPPLAGEPNHLRQQPPMPPIAPLPAAPPLECRGAEPSRARLATAAEVQTQLRSPRARQSPRDRDGLRAQLRGEARVVRERRDAPLVPDPGFSPLPLVTAAGDTTAAAAVTIAVPPKPPPRGAPSGIGLAAPMATGGGTSNTDAAPPPPPRSATTSGAAARSAGIREVHEHCSMGAATVDVAKTDTGKFALGGIAASATSRSQSRPSVTPRSAMGEGEASCGNPIPTRTASTPGSVGSSVGIAVLRANNDQDEWPGRGLARTFSDSGPGGLAWLGRGDSPSPPRSLPAQMPSIIGGPVARRSPAAAAADCVRRGGVGLLVAVHERHPGEPLGEVVVKSIAGGGPAEREGTVRPGDVLMAVGVSEAALLAPADLIRLVAGRAGEPVELRFARPGAGPGAEVRATLRRSVLPYAPGAVGIRVRQGLLMHYCLL